MSRLDEAFAAVDDVHNCAEFEDASSDTSFQYLTLECLGTSDEAWAATFDYVSGNSEWFEKRQIGQYPTATRGATPEDVLFGAVEKFHKLTGRTS